MVSRKRGERETNVIDRDNRGRRERASAPISIPRRDEPSPERSDRRGRSLQDTSRSVSCWPVPRPPSPPFRCCCSYCTGIAAREPSARTSFVSWRPLDQTQGFLTRRYLSLLERAFSSVAFLQRISIQAWISSKDFATSEVSFAVARHFPGVELILDLTDPIERGKLIMFL